MKAVPLGSQNTVEFTASLLFSQHNRSIKIWLALPDEDRAAILEEMEYVREHGPSAARHLRKDIYEVRAIYNTKAYRILFACEGRFHQILLALDGFQKKTQQTPKA